MDCLGTLSELLSQPSPSHQRHIRTPPAPLTYAVLADARPPFSFLIVSYTTTQLYPISPHATPPKHHHTPPRYFPVPSHLTPPLSQLILRAPHATTTPPCQPSHPHPTPPPLPPHTCQQWEPKVHVRVLVSELHPTDATCGRPASK